MTVKTLRCYDRIGLLKPAEVDRFTNYRYYSARQLPRLNRILALKGLGLSLDEIGLLLEEDLPPEQIRGMLRSQRPGVGANERLPHLGLSRGDVDSGRVTGERD